MKRRVSSLFASATQDELSVSQILLGLENLTPFPRFIWGCRKRRSCLDAAPSAPPSVQIAEEEIEVRRSRVEAGEAAAVAKDSPATPLSFSPSESDGKSKRSSKKRALKTRQSKEEPQRDMGRNLNLGMDFIQHDETIMLPHLQPFVADQTAHKLHYPFGPIRAQMYPPNNGLESDNQVGPSGIPDLNLTAEEAFGVDSTQLNRWM